MTEAPIHARRVLLVDLPNIVRRAAFGSQVPPEEAVPIAQKTVARAAETVAATHAVLLVDHPDVPDWRFEVFEGYKAHRRAGDAESSAQGRRYLELAIDTFAAAGWHVVTVPAFPADDTIAALHHRLRGRAEVFVLSGDSDLLALLEAPDTVVLRPAKGGRFERWSADHVRAKYGVGPELLPALKALAGEPGDGIPGPFGKHCDGKARTLLATYGTFPRVLENLPDAQQAAAALAFRLVRLVTSAPVPACPWLACEVPKL